MLLLLYIAIWPTEEKLIFAAVSPYFLIQFIDDIFGVELSGFESGGSSSPLQIGICIICSGAVLLLVFLLNLHGAGLGFEFHRMWLAVFAWTGLILLQCISIYLDPTKWVPAADLICFIITSTALVFFGSDMQKILKAITYWGLIGSAIIIIGILAKKTWTTSDAYFTNSLYEQNAYFSPLSGLLGLPTRNNFYFNSGPQILGISFALFFCLALALRQPLLKWTSLILFIGIGSLSGSRTFYIVVVFTILLKILFLRLKFLDLNFLKFVIALFAIAIGAYYALAQISSNTGIKTLNGRSIIWEIITTHWNDNSILGHGPGTLSAFARNAHTFFPFVHAHNSYLQLVWDFGVLGLFFGILISLITIYSLDLREFKNFTFVAVGLFVIQTEITLDASVFNPFALFWVGSSIQFLHKVKFYHRNETE